MSWLSRLINTFHTRRLDDDLADEVRDHIERRAADLQSRGLSPSEARRQAERSFGSATAFRETSRDLKLHASIDATLQDIRYAWRGILRAPVFAVTAVISLGLAIGANTAIYSILDAALLRPLPVPQPDRLFTLATSHGDDTFSYPLYEQLRAAAGRSARLALLGDPIRVEARNAEDDAPYESVIQQVVSPDTFEVLGVPPAAGRLFSDAEDNYPGARSVIVLSHDYWRRRFGASEAILGRPFIVDGRTYTILGVARKGYFGSEPGKYVDVWLPVTTIDPAIFTNPAVRLFHLMGRLAPGVALRQMQDTLQPAIQSLLPGETLQAHPGANGMSGFRRAFSRPLWILFGVAVCILLIACANVAGLLLARSTARSAEMALRVSLGARRGRLVRQLLTESLLIALLSGLFAWIVSSAAAPALVSLVSSEANPVRLDLALNSRMLLFCVAVCGLATALFGALPAWQATGSRPMFALRHGSGVAGRLRMGRLFVGVQVAFAFCLVAGGSGFLFSLHNLSATDPGFDPNRVTVLTMTNTTSRDRQLPLAQQLQMRVGALPRVEGAATAWTPILSGALRADRIALPGSPLSERAETFYRVSPAYLATLHTPLLSGRDFTPRDNDDEPVATIVNRAFAKRYFATESVLGREFRRDDGVRHRIVGLAGDSRLIDLRSGLNPVAYMPMKPPRVFTLYVRSSLDPASVASMVEREAHALDPLLRVRDAATLDALIGRTMIREKLLATIGGAFACLALVLAAIGLFGLLSYSVTLRTREIGIRTALGAQRLPVYGIVLRDLAGILAGGIAVGLCGSIALLNFARSLLYGVRGADPMVIGAAAAVFVATAIVACWLPARRAASIDPLVALRHE